jgi:ribonuclease H / adenosylcobalamin/alpha-ribazole phosphatase
VSPRRLIVEADGGSRGNPGPAGYGAVVREASTGEVLAERYEYLGVVTNNVAEYRGLLAGLTAAAEIDSSAYVECRLDSRLVVEQLSGRWQVKHPDLRPLVREGSELAASFGSGHVTFTWIPRERNKDADRLANRAMDEGTGQPLGAKASGSSSGSPSRSRPLGSQRAAPAELPPSNRIVGWTAGAPPTTLVLVRHGVTTFTVEKRFSGVGDPPLIEQGRQQIRATASELVARGGVDRIVSSPLSRCRESAAIISSALGVPVELEDDLREVDFGVWEGLTFPVVEERWPRELALWLGDTAISPPDGESYESLRHRVRTAQERIVNRHRGETVCVVSHSRPIATIAVNLLDTATSSLYRLHVDNASLSEVDYYDDGPAVLRLFNGTSHLR